MHMVSRSVTRCRGETGYIGARLRRMVTARTFSYATALAIATLALGLSVSDALAFAASFNWCKGSSPRFELKDVPAGTAKLQFTMTDLNFPGFLHGGGTVAYDGHGGVPCGAFATTFLGPSPPRGTVHTYEFLVKALGADGAELATTTVQRKFPEGKEPGRR